MPLFQGYRKARKQKKAADANIKRLKPLVAGKQQVVRSIGRMNAGTATVRDGTIVANDMARRPTRVKRKR